MVAGNGEPKRLSRRNFCRTLGGGVALGLSAGPLLARETAAAPPVAKIAALEQRIAETLLAIGIIPFAMQDPGSYRRWVVEPILPESVLDLGTEAEPNIEYLAELRPDLILIPQERPDLDRLAELAPLRRLPMTPPAGVTEYDHFRNVLLEVGAIFNRCARAEAYVARTSMEIGKAKAHFAGKTSAPVYLVTFVDDRHVWIYGTLNLFQEVLNRAGLENAWGRESLFDVVGVEQLAGRDDTSLIFIENNFSGIPAGLLENPLWQALPFVKQKRVYGIPSVTPFGALPTAGRFARLLTDIADIR